MKPFHIHLSGPERQPLPTSFEEVERRLCQLPKLSFEPDGSFVWAPDGGRQQVFGMVYDAAGAVQYCELRGQCTRQTWQSLIEAITGSAETEGGNLQILTLPAGELQELQSFVRSYLTVI